MPGLPRLINTLNSDQLPVMSKGLPRLKLPRLQQSLTSEELPQQAEVSKNILPLFNTVATRDASNVPVRNPGFYNAQVEDQYVTPTNEQLATLPPAPVNVPSTEGELQAEKDKGLADFMSRSFWINPIGAMATTYGEGMKGGTEDYIAGLKKIRQRKYVQGILQSLAGGARAGFTLMTPGNAGLASFTGGTGAAMEIAPEPAQKTIEAIMAPVTALTQPTSDAGKYGAELADIIAKIAMIKGVHAGKGMFDRFRGGKPVISDQSSVISEQRKEVRGEIPRIDYPAQAKEYDVIFNGVQKFPDKSELPIFTDKQTRSSFLVKKTETLPEALARIRKPYEAAESGQRSVVSVQPKEENVTENAELNSILDQLKNEREKNLLDFENKIAPKVETANANDVAAERMRAEGKSEKDIAEALGIKKPVEGKMIKGSTKPEKYSQISEADYPILSQVERIEPDWLVDGSTVKMREEFEGINKDLLDLSNKPTLDELQRAGGVRFGNIDQKATELGYNNAEDFRHALLNEQERFNKHGYLSRQKIADIADELANDENPEYVERTIMDLPLKVQKIVRDKMYEIRNPVEGKGKKVKGEAPALPRLFDEEGHLLSESGEVMKPAPSGGTIPNRRGSAGKINDWETGLPAEGRFGPQAGNETQKVGKVADNKEFYKIREDERLGRIEESNKILAEGNLYAAGEGIQPYKPQLALMNHQHPFITPEGLLTDPNVIHSDLAYKFSGNKTRNIQDFMDKTGYVRLVGENDALNVETLKMPTEEQFKSIEISAAGRKIRWDISDATGQTMKSGESPDFDSFKKQLSKGFTFNPKENTILLSAGLGAAAGMKKDDEGNWTYDPKAGILGALGTMVLAGVAGRYSDTFRRLKLSEEGKALVPIVKESIKNLELKIKNGEIKRSEAGAVVMDEVVKTLKGSEEFNKKTLPERIRAIESLKELHKTMAGEGSREKVEGEKSRGSLAANEAMVKQVSEGVRPILQRLQEQVAEKVEAKQMKPESARIGLRKRVRDYVTFDEGRFLPKEQRDELINAVGASKKLDDKVFAAETKAIEIARELEGFKPGTARIENDKFIDETVSGQERGILSKAVYEDVKSKLRHEVYSRAEFRNLSSAEKEEMLNTVKKVYGKRYERAVDAMMTGMYGLGDKGLEVDDGVFGEWKDIGPVDRNVIDMQRAFERVIPANRMPEMERMYLDPLSDAKSNMSDFMMKKGNELLDVMKKYGIKKRSKESELLQAYGEGYKIVSEKKGFMNHEDHMVEYTYGDLVDEVGEVKAKRIATAEKWFRQFYDETLDAINKTRTEIYGPNPEHQVMKRRDYFRHFTDLKSDLGGLLAIFDINQNIDPKLQGISEFTKPKSKWQSFAQRRFGWQTSQDAVGGVLNYLPNAGHAIYMDPMIQKFRTFANALAEGTQRSKHLNNFIGYLRDLEKEFAGKTRMDDRYWIDQWGGRTGLRLANWIANKAKSNLIVGNIGVAMGVAANVVNATPDLARYGGKAMTRTFTDAVSGKGAIEKSRYWKNRYLGDVFENFDTGIMDHTKRLSMWLMMQSDKWNTHLIWNALYEKGIAAGAKDPVKFADRETMKVTPGRGIGERGNINNAKTFQIIAPFSTEILNSWYVYGDQYNAKQWGRLMGIMAGAYAFNQLSKQLVGHDVVFDPIQAFIDAERTVYESDNKFAGVAKGVGRMVGEVVSNMPAIPNIAGAVLSEQEMKRYLGNSGNTRFSTGPGVLRDVGRNAFNIIKAMQDGKLDWQSAGKLGLQVIPSFGGKQIEKSLRGAYAVYEGGVYDKNGKLMFSIDEAPDQIKSLLFGPYGTGSGRDYLESKTGEGRGKKVSNSMQLPTFSKGLPRLPVR
jgi:hypothetical protein